MEILFLNTWSSNRKILLALISCLLVPLLALAAFGEAPTKPADAARSSLEDSGHIKVDVSNELVANGWKAYNIKQDPMCSGYGGLLIAMPKPLRASRDMKLDLYLPKNVEGRLLVTVWIHGGGWSQGTRNNPQTPWVARHGYAVASIEYRLSGQANFPAQIHDCKAAIRWLRANADTYNLDPNRIAAIGGSAGAHLALLLGLTCGVEVLEGDGGNPDQSSCVKTVVNLFGPTDMAAHARARLSYNRKDYENAAEKLIGAPFAEAPEKYEAASPTTYITADDPPILTIHGDKDEVVPIEQARLLHMKLTEAGIHSTFYELVGAGHGEPRDPFYNSDQACSRILTFLAENLKASPKPPAETPRSPF